MNYEINDSKIKILIRVKDKNY